MTANSTTWKVAWTALAAAVGLSGCQTVSSWLPKHDKVSDARANSTSQRDFDPSLTLTPQQKLNVELAVGQSLEEENQVDQAVKIYQLILKKDSGCTVAYQRLGALYAKKGDWEQSQKYFDIALKNDPKNIEVQCDIGYSYYLQGRDADAEACLRQIVARAPDCSRAHNNLGLLFARHGQENDALREFCAAGCSEAQAHANLGMGYAMNGHLDDARAQYQIALAADPKLPEAKNGLGALDSVKKSLAGQHPNPMVPTALNSPAVPETF